MSYEGPAEVSELPVMVHLSGRWEPVDGRYHWGGRIEPGLTELPAAHASVPRQEVAALVRAGRRDVTLRIGDRSAVARLGEVDPWGGVRITGVGEPPWPPVSGGED